MSEKDEQKYCLTEIPDLGPIGQYADDADFSPEYWDKVMDQIEKENKEYEDLC